MKNVYRKISWLLLVSMLISMFGATGFAADVGTTVGEPTTQEETTMSQQPEIVPTTSEPSTTSETEPSEPDPAENTTDVSDQSSEAVVPEASTGSSDNVTAGDVSTDANANPDVDTDPSDTENIISGGVEGEETGDVISSIGEAEADALAATTSTKHYYHIDILVKGKYDYTFTYSGQRVATATINVTKNWDDENDFQGIRPDSVEAGIYQVIDGTETLWRTVTLNEANGWNYSISDAPTVLNGKDVTYNVKELTDVKPYTSSLVLDVENNVVSNTATHTDGTNTIVFGFGSTPSMVINGETITWSGNTATVNGGTWTYNPSTKLYTYSSTRTMDVERLTSVTYTANTSTGSTKKINTSYYKKQGDSGHGNQEFFCQDYNNSRRLSDLTSDTVITVSYVYDLTTIDEFGVTTVLNDKTRTQVFTNPETDNVCGSKNATDTMAGYDVRLSYYETDSGDAIVNEGDIYDATITNSFEPEKVTVVANKVWEGGAPGDITSVTFHLEVDGEHSGKTQEATAANNWKVEWKDLPKYKYVNGKPVAIHYLVEEEAVEGYEVSYDRTETDNTITVTATNTPSTTETYVTVVKDWVDEGNAYGKRPAEIQVQLYRKEYNNDSAEWEKYGDPVTLSVSDRPWTYTWTGLPLTEDDKTYVYYVDEVSVPEGYKKEVILDTYLSDGSAWSYTIQNTFQNTTDITVNKVWEDEADKYNNRPDSITVKLLADGIEYTSATVTPTNGNWSYTFEDVPKYKIVNGSAVEIVYTVTEDAVPGYSTDIDGYTITNTLEYVTFSGTKTWVDNNNQDGKRPDSIQIQLSYDNKVIRHLNLNTSSSNSQTWEISVDNDNNQIPKYRDGKEITYSIREVVPDGYKVSYEGNNITNTHAPETTEVTVTKVWNDNNDEDGIRPDGVIVRLLADGTEVRYVAIDADDDWTYTFTNLPVYAGGEKIVYTVTEDEVPGYTTKVEGYTITNTHELETVDISGAKTWVDHDDAYNNRPDTIKVKLLADGEEVKSSSVSAQDNWEYSFTDLPKYKDGTEIEYTIEEETVAGYDTVVNDYDITNTLKTIDISGTKTWDDNNDQDGKRPESITVNLMVGDDEIDEVEVKPDADGNWSYTFTELPAYKNGAKVNYTVTEDPVAGYEASYSGYNITNTHTPETVSVTVVKEWAEGTTPENNVTIRLFGNNQDLYEYYTNNETTGHDPNTYRVTLTASADASENWTYTWSGLAKYNEGQLIDYTVWEEIITVRDETTGLDVVKYNTTYEILRDQSGAYDANDFTIKVTNAYSGENFTQINVAKQWYDGDNYFNSRPSVIEVQLVRKEFSIDATEEEILAWRANPTGYTLVDTKYLAATKNVNGDGVTNYQYGGNDVEVAYNDWSYFWTNLSVYPAGDKTDSTNTYYVYAVVETTTLADYSVSYSYSEDTREFILKNSYTKTMQISGTKTWADNDDQDGIRPDSVTINLLANGTEVKELVVKPDQDGKWAYSFADLPLVDTNGTAITYTITEDPVAGYETSVDGYNVTNTHDVETVEISGSKTWDDADNQDGKRPESITVKLLANGVDTDKSATITETDEWKYHFTDLPKYSNGVEITYSVVEVGIDVDADGVVDGIDVDNDHDVDYFVEIDGYNITNRYAPETIDIPVSKIWADNDDQDGVRPESVVIGLFADDVYLKHVTLTAADIDAEGNWSYTFEDLPKYANGELITYTINERQVEGYEAEIDGYTITNSRTPETTSISGTKTWDDEDDQDGKRPASITVNLLADGTKIKESVVTEAMGWQYSFENLPKYRDGGIEIVYSVTEAEVDGYKAEVNGHDITNSYTPETTSVTVNKTWIDYGHGKDTRPDSITVYLLADGIQYDAATITADADGNWSYTFDALPKYRDGGTKIVYSVQEEKVTGYQTEIDGFIITNTLETTVVRVSKRWDDDNNYDRLRPETITINLLADGVKVDSVNLGTERDAAHIFTNLPKFTKDGKLISYTVEEEAVAGYTSEYETTGITTTITNTHVPDTITLTVNKEWVGPAAQDYIEFQLVIDAQFERDANDQLVYRRISEDNDWTVTIENLRKYDGYGDIVIYEVREVRDEFDFVLSDYHHDYSEHIITLENTATVDISIEKKWDDNDNADKNRTDVTVTLLANNEVAETATLTADNGWKAEFKKLQKYDSDGKLIDYSVEETAVAGYTASVEEKTVGNNVTFVVTNTLETVEVSGTKTWVDADNQDGIRPDEITVNLMANGEKVDSVTVTEEDGWKYSFTDLPKYQEGNEVVYTLTEEEVAGYDSSSNGYDLTNTHVPEEIEIAVTKKWDDNDDQDGIRPEEITVYLMANGEKVETATLTAEGDWKYIFEVPKFNDGEEIKYTVSEKSVEGYSCQIVGNGTAEVTITNKHTPEEIDLDVVKKWLDNNDAKGNRPDSITVQLYANGEKYGDAVKITEKGEWEYTFEDLPKNEDGEAIEYTVKEAGVKYYVAKYTTKDGDLVITNTHTDIPVTGDTLNLVFWIMIVFGSGCVLSVITFRTLRKKSSAK